MATGTKVATVDEVPENRTIVVSIDKREIQLTKLNGEIFAFENNCTHENLPMGECKIHNDEIQCPRHGARFNIKTGQATGLPAVMPIKTFSVKIENGELYII